VESASCERWLAWLNPEDDYGKRRISLLRAAFDTIAEIGFEGLRTRIVAERAGVNIATLHYYFPAKQDLVEGLAEFIGAQFLTLHGPEPPGSGLPALDRLRQEFSDGRFYIKSHPEMLLVLQEFNLRGKRDPHVQKIVDQMNAGWRHGVEKMVHAGVSDGTFRHDVPAAEIILMLMSIFNGSANLRADQLDAVQRNTELWILSGKARTKLTRSSRGKR
jgi:TetR/AcrR family transcriptional regulator, regulator of cefoperazone and chloramphenicol sensitivity